MKQHVVRAALPLFAAMIFTSPPIEAAPVPRKAKETVVKDAKKFIPNRAYHPLPGKTIGLMVSDVREKMAHEGRSGPPDAMGFSRAAGSYRWVYVPTEDARPLISNLRVPVGQKGDRITVFPRLDMARPRTVKQFSLNVPFALVEVEVNNGEGSPAGESFVATKMTRIDGTQQFSLDVTKVIELHREKYQQYLKSEKETIDKALEKAKISAIRAQKATGPRETKTLTYLTWLPDTEQLCIRFKTTITDGAYKFSDGGAPVRPFPLPVPKRRNNNGNQLFQLPPPRVPPRGGIAPPPPQRVRVRYGATFGIEFGRGYVIGKNGSLVEMEKLPITSFTALIPPPPQNGGPRRPIDPMRPIDPRRPIKRN